MVCDKIILIPFLLAERFIRTLKNKVYKCNNTQHNTIKTDPEDVKSCTYFNCGVENYDQDRNLNVGDHERISRYKKICAKGYTSNCSEEVFLTKKVQGSLHGLFSCFFPDFQGFSCFPVQAKVRDFFYT